MLESIARGKGNTAGVASQAMAPITRKFVHACAVVLVTYLLLTLVFERPNEDDISERSSSDDIDNYLSEKADDPNLVVEYYIKDKDDDETSSQSSAEETKDLPDLEVPNWNVVHHAEKARVFVDDSTNSSDVDKEWLKSRKALLSRGEPKKVFILAYMRGGSTLLGQIFNHDPEVVVWYEPLAAFYGSLYGLPKYRHYRRIVFPGDGNFKSEFRNLGKWESDNVVHYLRNIFNCNLRGLPRETLTDVFLTFTGNMQDYSICYYNESRKYHSDKVWESRCKEQSGMSAVCSGEKYDQGVEYAMSQKCQRYLSGVSKIFKRSGNLSIEELTHELYQDSGLESNDAQVEPFYKHELCMQELYATATRCLERTNAEASCDKTSVRAAKVLRLKMQFVEPIIRAMPDVFVLHYFRDPRATAKSRVQISNPELPPRLWANATKRLCLEMEKDITAAIELKRKYPGVLLTLKYEDIVMETRDALTSMYNHFGGELPIETYEWVVDMMNANEDDGAFGVKRKNATSLINSWRHSFPQEIIDDVNKFSVCKLILEYLNYEL